MNTKETEEKEPKKPGRGGGGGSFGIPQKKRLTKAQFADDKSFKPFRRDHSAGNKMNLRSNHEDPRFCGRVEMREDERLPLAVGEVSLIRGTSAKFTY